MRFDIVTIFPSMIEEALAAGIVGRAIGRGTLQVAVRDLRSFTSDRHHVVDDVPYGGGPGMVLKAEPLFRAVDAIEADAGARPVVAGWRQLRSERRGVRRSVRGRLGGPRRLHLRDPPRCGPAQLTASEAGIDSLA